MNPEDLKNWAARNAVQGAFGEGGDPADMPADDGGGGSEPVPEVTGEALLAVAGDLTDLAGRIDALVKADTESEADIGKLAKAVEDLKAYAEDASALSDEVIAEEELAAEEDAANAEDDAAAAADAAAV